MTADNRYSIWLSDLLRQRCGLSIAPDPLAQHIRHLGLIDNDETRERLRVESMDGATWSKVLREIAIGETYFFREVEPIEAALTSLIAGHRSSRDLSVWSAGCATGEEVYTLAVLIHETLIAAGESPDQWSITILGTDLNAGALTTAGRALYGAWSLRIPATLARAGLIAQGSRWRVPDTLRAGVTFKPLNLADESIAYPAADLIVCRNVLMYFDPGARARVTARLRTALRPDGVLIMESATIRAKGGDIAAPTPIDPQDWFAVTKRETREPEESILKRAEAAAANGQTDEALVILNDAPPLDLPCAWLRTLIYQGRGDAEAAIGAVRGCLYIDHGFVLGHFVLGNLYAASGDFRSARRHWVNAVKLAADFAPDGPLPLGDGMTAGDIQSLVESATVGAS